MKGNETLRVYNKESIRSSLKGANRAGQMPRWQSDAECSIQKTHKGYLVASMKYSQMNTIDMVSSSQ